MDSSHIWSLGPQRSVSAVLGTELRPSRILNRSGALNRMSFHRSIATRTRYDPGRSSAGTRAHTGVTQRLSSSGLAQITCRLEQVRCEGPNDPKLRVFGTYKAHDASHAKLHQGSVLVNE